MSDEPTRVLLVDDHPMFRAGLTAVLADDSTIDVVGQAPDGACAITLAETLQPDVVLMDLNLPDINGIEATRHILTTSPHIAVLILTMFDADDSVFTAMRAGAYGYLLKGATGPEIRRAVHAAGHGEVIFGAAIAHLMLAHFAAPQMESAAAQVFPALTPREYEVLNVIATGKNNSQIAKELFVTQKTVRNHITNIFYKLQVADRAQAIVRARQAGLGLAPTPAKPPESRGPSRPSGGQ